MNNNINVAVGGPINANYPKVYKTSFLKPGIPFSLQVTEPNTKYVIKHNFVLDGDITIPENCILEFDGGSLSNGILIGTDTQIRADKVAIFTGITISGTWNVPDITSDWFGDAKTVDNTLQQIENLLSRTIYNEVSIEAGDYWFTHTEDRVGAFIINKPYTKIILIGNLRLRGTDYVEGKRFVSINNTHDVELTGGGFIYGDKLTHIYEDGNTYPDGVLPYYDQWILEYNQGERLKKPDTYGSCHTLHISSSYNVIIDGINIRDSVSDGINIIHNTPAKNYFVSIKNVTIENTRRQGITANTNCGVFENITIKGIHGTSPESGIDVEISTNQPAENPRTSNEMIFRNIHIEDCTTGFITRTATDNIANVRNILFEHIEVNNVVTGFHIYRLCNNVTIRNCNFEINLERYGGTNGGARAPYIRRKYKNILAGDDCIIEGCIFNFYNDIPSEESIEGKEVYALTLADYGWGGELVKNQSVTRTTFNCPKTNAIGYLSRSNMIECHIDALTFDTPFIRTGFDLDYINNISNCHIDVSDSFILKNLTVNDSRINVGGAIECETGCSLIGNRIKCGSYIKCRYLSFVSNNSIVTEAHPNEDVSWDISKFLFWITEYATITSNYININSDSKLDAICVIDVPATSDRPDTLIPKFTNNYIQRENRFSQLLYIVDDDCIVMENNYTSDKKLQNYISKDYNLSGAELPVNACKGSTFIKDGNNRLLCNARKIKESVISERINSGSNSFIPNTLEEGKLYYAMVLNKATMYFSKVNSNPEGDDLAVILPSVSSGESSKYFTALSQNVYPYIYMVNNHEDTKRTFNIYNVDPWREFDSAAVDVKRSGITSERPVGNDIYVGFMYFDTDLAKPIYASAINGDTVTWVDALGNPVDTQYEIVAASNTDNTIDNDENASESNNE